MICLQLRVGVDSTGAARASFSAQGRAARSVSTSEREEIAVKPCMRFSILLRADDTGLIFFEQRGCNIW